MTSALDIVSAMQSYKACDPSMVDYFATRLAKRTEEFRTVHHQLYLGGGEGNFKPFSDPRLVNYWCVGCTAGQQLLRACMQRCNNVNKADVPF
jgi:hypothetical protein